MKHKFSYLKTGLWYRPIIPVSLRHGKKEFSYLALLDSGADFNIFHADIADILGIKLSKLKTMQFQGIKEGASGKGYITEIEVGVNNNYQKTMVVFSRDISENGYGILGQQGFFNNYEIKFLYKSKEIIVETVSIGKN